ncbi:MAG TPA: hypothetical protein VMT15_06030 [Bryobacteraceae bacterium]|nr:hypothetical protein [Bryobacteraceae bacterium]
MALEDTLSSTRASASVWLRVGYEYAGCRQTKVHDLVDQLPPDQIPAAVTLLKSMLRTDIDDEEVTEEDVRRIKEARAALERGERGTPMEDVLAEFGLMMDGFPLDK